MPVLTTPPPQNNFNNPTKEIWASSGIFSGERYSDKPYAVDLPNSNIPNTGINTTTTSTTTTISPSLQLQNALFYSELSSGTYLIDNLLVFNKYIHYGGITPVVTFNPETFLTESIVKFNLYSLQYR